MNEMFARRLGTEGDFMRCIPGLAGGKMGTRQAPDVLMVGLGMPLQQLDSGQLPENRATPPFCTNFSRENWPLKYEVAGLQAKFRLQTATLYHPPRALFAESVLL